MVPFMFFAKPFAASPPQPQKLKLAVSSSMAKKPFPSSLLLRRWVTNNRPQVLHWKPTILPPTTFLKHKYE
jgi:hypothetical protein